MTENDGLAASGPQPPVPVLVLACGNPSRGDDALGPLLAERLIEWLATDGAASAGVLVEVICDFQFQVEHALDLHGRQLVLFIDAAAGQSGPVAFSPLAPGVASPAFSHALTPADVLAVHARIETGAPPPAFVLALRGESFVLGETLTASAREAFAAAWSLLQVLLRNPHPEDWRAQAGAWQSCTHGRISGPGRSARDSTPPLESDDPDVRSA